MFYVLNYNRPCIYVISSIVSIIVCVLLCILLDISIFYLNHEIQENTVSSIIHDKHPQYLELSKINIIKLEDTFFKPMQIGSIYEEVTVDGIESGVTTNEQEKRMRQEAMQSDWRIEIPKIGVIAPIKTGTTQTVLATAVGHFENTTTWNGNVPLAGHNRGYLCNFFKDIKSLEIGDNIIYHTEKGERVYKVILNKIIKQTDWSYVQNTEDNRITLITCVENMSAYRRCVQAVQVV